MSAEGPGDTSVEREVPNRRQLLGTPRGLLVRPTVRVPRRGTSTPRRGTWRGVTVATTGTGVRVGASPGTGVEWVEPETVPGPTGR